MGFLGPSRVFRRVALVAVLAATVAFGVLGACSDDTVPPLSDAQTACGTSIEAMNGAACEGELQCPVDIACGAFRQQSSCRCERGSFVCSDLVGPLEPGAVPRCAPDEAGAAQCPPTIEEAARARCSKPYVACRYLSTCPPNALRTCLCTPPTVTADAGVGAFVCDPDPCIDGSTEGDAAGADATAG